MASLGDLFKESLRPFGSPSQFLADEKFQASLEKNADSGRTRSQIESLSEDRKQFRGLAERFSVGANNIAPEQAALRRNASSLTAQDPRTATTAGGTLSEALRRAKARAGIVQRGDASIRGQRLKDRLQLVRSDLSRRGAAIDLQGQGQQIRAGVRLNAQSAKDSISASRAGALGGIAGSFAGGLKGNKDNNGSFFDFGQKNKLQAPDGFIGP
jgi:hypothetical protein